MRYVRKAPVEAWQWNGEPMNDWPDWLDRPSNNAKDWTKEPPTPLLVAGPYINQGEPSVVARPGQWLVREAGAVLVMWPAEFDERYTAA